MAAPTVVDAKAGRGPDGGGPSGAAPPRYHVIVLGRDGAVPCALPRAGAMTLGRDEEADIRLIDPRASRQHARIAVAEQQITIEDLGSANGTRLREQPLPARQPVPLTAGEVVSIGNTLIVLVAGDPELGSRRIWTHGYLETRLIEECARAANRGTELALLHLHVSDKTPAVLVEEVISSRLRDGDLLAAYAPGEYELLLPESAVAGVRELVDELVAALASKSIAARVGLAAFPADGTSPQALVGRAAERVRALALGSGDATSAGPATSKSGSALPSASATSAAGSGPIPSGMVVRSPAMHALHDFAARAAAGNSSVLIVGETGSGKEVFAETIHRLSPRASKPFVPLNCAALTESLVESELFGYERGAFTGAQQAKVGLFEAASGGTLFLDEIGEMPLTMQAKLLRVIESRQVLRVGATQARPVDVRLVTATHRDLEEEVAEKRFREDLYFRLNVITLEIPALRERLDEIPPLAELFLRRLAEPLGRPAPRLAPEALQVLAAYQWPGNIRELRNVIERAFVLCAGSVVTPEHLPLEKMQRDRRASLRAVASSVTERIAGPAALSGAAAGTGIAGSEAPGVSVAGSEASAPRALKDFERQAIVDALERCHFNQTRAAELLGMPRRTFCKRMKEYGIPRPRA